MAVMLTWDCFADSSADHPEMFISKDTGPSVCGGASRCARIILVQCIMCKCFIRGKWITFHAKVLHLVFGGLQRPQAAGCEARALACSGSVRYYLTASFFHSVESSGQVE